MIARNLMIGAAAVALTATAAIADPNENTLVIDGETIITDVAAPEDHPLDHLYSGWRFRNAETQAMEADDFVNPAFLYVDQGEELWSTVDGAEGKSCESCHGDASEGMKGVRAAMPKWNAAAGKPWAMEMWVNNCRTERMKADEWKWESNEMLSMTAFVGLQSRGMPVAPDLSGDAPVWVEKGKDLYYLRTGQLDLSCASCHEDNWGNMIRADHLSQGHTNGFPTYRLKWQGLGSLHRRLKGCVKDTRADGYAIGSDENLALELYLATRGAGLIVETPAVRN